MKKRFIYFLNIFILSLPLFAFDNGHRAAITSLVCHTNTYISSSEDGYIEIWDSGAREAFKKRFQLSPYKIQMMVKHPSAEEICIIETSGIDGYSLSAWNYASMNKIFSVKSAEPVKYVNYSAGGSLIIASGLNGRPLALLDSRTGDVVYSPDIPAGTVTLAVTGRAERNMLVYQSEHESNPRTGGQILYIDLASSSVTGKFNAPGDFLNPVIFGNNRFIAGINWEGLLLVDAASGAVLDYIDDFERDSLLCSSDVGFFYFNGISNELYEFSVNNGGAIEILNDFSLSFNAPVKSAAYNGNVAFAASDGNIFLVDKRGNVISMKHDHHAHIADAAVSDSDVAVLTGAGELFFLPLDYRQLEKTKTITADARKGYNKITSAKFNADNANAPLKKFILWQNTGAAIPPLVVNSDHSPDNFSLGFLSVRYPARSIAMLNNRILVLDNAGNVSVCTYGKTSADFTFSSIGAIDAAFIDSERIIISRSVMRGSSPFLAVNFRTGETVPVMTGSPAQAGILAYSVLPDIYAAVVERDSGQTRTAVYSLSSASSGETARSGVRKILERPGEDITLSITGIQGKAAIACGGQEAAIYGDIVTKFERTPGLPVKLFGCPEFAVSLDNDGNICWHENETGKLLALFKTYGNRWTLQTGGNRVFSGEITRK